MQLEPCAVNDDCLILLPKEGIELGEATLVIAAACLHAERWRFTYGRKLTPKRISEFRLPTSEKLSVWIERKLNTTRSVVAASLAPYEDELGPAGSAASGRASG